MTQRPGGRDPGSATAMPGSLAAEACWPSRAGYDRTMDAVVLGPDGGERHDLGTSWITIKAEGEHTGGAMFVADFHPVS
jgi:hypothetical protein